MAWTNILQIFFPIGSVYFSTVNSSPASTIGGTWTQITNAVLRAATSTGYIGSDTHTLTINEMPRHNHELTTDGVIFTKTYTVDEGTQMSATTNWGPGVWTGWAGSSAEHSIVQRSYNLFAWVRTA